MVEYFGSMPDSRFEQNYLVEDAMLPERYETRSHQIQDRNKRDGDP
jgi:hypothetical protein